MQIIAPIQCITPYAILQMDFTRDYADCYAEVVLLL